MTQKEKLVIIGSGPAGLTAALYTARAGLNPLVIEGSKPGGQLMSTTHIENWPGIESILGPSLMMNIRKHAQHFGTRFLPADIARVDFSSRPFQLVTHKEKLIEADSVIIATGATPKKLRCPGEDTYWTRGVSTCAVCDGAFYSDVPVVIVGGGDSAMENALFMTNFTNQVILVHILDQLTASKPMQDKVLNCPSITVIYSSTVTEILGDGKQVEQVKITNQENGNSYCLPAKALFIAIGLNPNTSIFRGQLELTDYGHVAVHDTTKTSVQGIFAAGDVADSHYRQAIFSAGMGCAAGLDAERYLK